MCSVAVSKLGASHVERSSASSFVLRPTRAQLAEVEPAAGQLSVGVWRPSKDLCVFALSGEMDMSNASEFGRALGSHVGSGWMIIELSRLRFMDASGIRQLVRLSRTVKAAGGAIVLAAPNPNLARLFEIVNLGEFVPVVASLEAAMDRTSQTAASPVLVQEHQALTSAGPKKVEVELTEEQIAERAHAISLTPESGIGVTPNASFMGQTHRRRQHKTRQQQTKADRPARLSGLG
jgi:anti-sigma B factor antagonist